jgi:uncharacterized protein YutE (UPF0331/DUF86 family)
VTLNGDLVRARCTEIEESVRRLEEIGRLSLDQFLGSQDTIDIACYRLLVAIEAALALCYHVSARRLRQAPEDYAACFSALAQAGVIPPELAERLRHMARFRNLLVHVYWKIDYRQVHEILRNRLRDLRDFAAAIARLV